MRGEAFAVVWERPYDWLEAALGLGVVVLGPLTILLVLVLIVFRRHIAGPSLLQTLADRAPAKGIFWTWVILFSVVLGLFGASTYITFIEPVSDLIAANAEGPTVIRNKEWRWLRPDKHESFELSSEAPIDVELSCRIASSNPGTLGGGGRQSEAYVKVTSISGKVITLFDWKQSHMRVEEAEAFGRALASETGLNVRTSGKLC